MKKNRANIENNALGCKIGRAYQIMLGQLAAALKNAGVDITTNEYLILRALFRRDGMQQCEIADLTGKDKATICRCVTALEKRGWISAEAVSHKCQRIYLSVYAKAMEPKIMEVADMRYEALAGLTTPENLEIFTQVLDNIINSK